MQQHRLPRAGASQRMLAQTLRNPEQDGVVLRRVEPVSPPALHHPLSALGGAPVEPLRELERWAQTNMPLVDEARTRAAQSTSA